MKKNLLTFLFVMVFVCVGALVVSAKNTSSSANSVVLSKKVLVAKTKVEPFRAECKVNGGCDNLLLMMIGLNAAYEFLCAPGYSGSCYPDLANQLIGAANAWEACLYVSQLKDTDSDLDRNKTEKARSATSR